MLNMFLHYNGKAHPIFKQSNRLSPLYGISYLGTSEVNYLRQKQQFGYQF